METSRILVDVELAREQGMALVDLARFERLREYVDAAEDERMVRHDPVAPLRERQRRRKRLEYARSALKTGDLDPLP
jgi:hypothetical protein